MEREAGPPRLCARRRPDPASWAGPRAADATDDADARDRADGGHGEGRRHGPGSWPDGYGWRGSGDWPDRRWPHGSALGRRRRPAGHGPLRRDTDHRLAGGVAAGVAARTGFDVTVIRIVFVLATVGSGFGAALYVLAWLLVPAAGEQHNIAAKAMTDRRGIALSAGLTSLLIVLVLIASALGAGWAGLGWPVVISAAGMGLIWRNASEPEQATLRGFAEPLLGLTGGRGRLPALARIAVAGVALLAGLSLLLSGAPHQALLLPLSGVALVIAAIVVGLGPWWLGIARDLVVERQARARAEERADMAARVHDSVLQTLALIQRRADNPQQVIGLARAQERELRSWLFGGQPPGSLDEEAATLAAGIRVIQQEVESQHEITVEAVTVGDCDLDEDLRSLLAAAREATVNAGKWSGAPAVSLFAEIEPERVSLFVRDRGRGFDPAAVPGDRKGLAESIRARMARHGGTAAIRSAPGEGTEVTLTMPRHSGQRQPSQL